MRTIERPADDEFAAFYAGYVSRVPELVDAPQALRAQGAAAATTFAALDDERGAYRYQSGKWSIKEMLGHLCDTERIFAYRLLRVARGDQTPLPGFEENDYVRAAGSDARTVADLVEEWRAIRHATAALVAGLADDTATRRGTMNGNPITVRALAYIIVGHVDHHLDVLRTRYGVAA
jgi:uncharacterized damage-inducible protein DinB